MGVAYNVRASLLQASAVEAMPNVAQQRKQELASAIFGGLSGPARPVKTKGRSTVVGGGGVVTPKKAAPKEELDKSGGPDLLLDLQVSLQHQERLVPLNNTNFQLVG